MKGVIAIMQGMWLGLKYLFKRKATVNFPKEKVPVSDRFRGELALTCNPDGSERCVACKLCEAICPARVIKVEAQIQEGRRCAASYELDMSKCIYCGLCVQSCPTGAIVHTTSHQFSRSKKEDLIYTKEKLLENGKR